MYYKAFSIKNSGCGLGDMLNRIDTIFKFCTKFNFDFYMPEINSTQHNCNYSRTFSFDEYIFQIYDWKYKIIEIDMSVLLDSQFIEGLIILEENVLFLVKFNYPYAVQLREKYQLEQQPSLDYSWIIESLSPYVVKEDETEYFVHLRLGDSYIYTINESVFFDSRRRQVVYDRTRVSDELKKQWTIEDVKRIVSFFKRNHITYKISCDGVDAVVRHISWRNTEEYTRLKNDMYNSVLIIRQDFLDNFSGDKNITFKNTNIKESVVSILNAKNIIFTTGGFAKSINRFWNKRKAKIIHIKDFIANLS